MAQAKTKTERVLSFLQNGNNITDGQAEGRFGIASMGNITRQLRTEGYAVYKNRKTSSNGNRFSVYRLGTPTRRVVAAGYRALAA